ncbi:preprotein translocase subunit SecE [bacterium]|nr:preprotein translocase subunit SecE [bacterium]
MGKTENTENKIITYLKGVKAEWGKITWPERRQVIVQTIIVLAVVIVFSMYVFVLDISFKGILSALGLIK